MGWNDRMDHSATPRCTICDSEPALREDEMGGRGVCPSCGTVFILCDGHGGWVPESEYRGDVSMCEDCFEAILANNP
jgi:predicted RNA-binding Zn-ribbon protein involved in translation (DUF1610 family)